MAKTKISATIVADSINPQGNRITTMELVFPRFILAELNTHRMLSKNSASSRAIKFEKMAKMAQDNPFIPIAWQREHTGMQGTEYLTAEVDKAFAHDLWLEARNKAVQSATNLHEGVDVTKQLCNRLLEPFMWHKVLITGTEFSNFFSLRCPQYVFKGMNNGEPFKSWKDVTVAARAHLGDEEFAKFQATDYLYRLQHNKGQAEIHMMALAEAMWDAYQESTPKELKAGEWHIPYKEEIDLANLFSYPVEKPTNLTYRTIEGMTPTAVKIATAMCARTSYTTVGDEKEISYDQLIALHDRMAQQDPFHASPFEHCAMAMGDTNENLLEDWGKIIKSGNGHKVEYGWCRNFRGWIQYRAILEEGRV